MDSALRKLLDEMEGFGATNDASTNDRAQKMLNITQETGVFLGLLIKATGSRNVLEIGTSNGYSTVWLGDAVGEGGMVTTVEKAPKKSAMAEKNFARSGLATRIQQISEEAGSFLGSCADDAFDFVFLDSDREQYVDWWPELRRIVAPGRLIVVDNAISHAHQIEDFKQVVEATDGWLGSLAPIGNGELVLLREPALATRVHI